MTLSYTSDIAGTGFDGTTSGTLPANWANAVGAWTASSLNALPGHTNTLNTAVGSGTSPVAICTQSTGSPNMEVTFAQMVDSSAISGSELAVCCAVARADGASFNNGYLALLDHAAGNINFFKRVSGAYTSLGVVAFSLGTVTAGTIILTRFQVIGTSLQVKFWLSSQAEPTAWSATKTDASITTGNFSGVYAGNDGVTGTANYSFSDFNVDAVAAAQGQITLSPTIAVISGGNITISGTYTGTAPTGLNFAVDGGSYSAASSPTISGGNFSFTITAPALGAHSINVQNSGVTTVTDSAVYIVANSSTVSIAPNNPGIVYSPYNWNVNGTDAITINSGAYFKTLFTGTSCTLKFNVANNLTPLSEIWARVDNGPWTQYSVASTIALTIPTLTSGNADVPYHRLDVYVKSTTITQNRWNTPSGTAIDFQGLTLSNGSTVAAPQKFPKNIIVYGDSITEGLRTLGEAAPNDVDNNDGMFVWTYEIGQLLGAEIGNIGFGGQGYSVVGVGNVPVLGSSYNLIYQGVSRSFSPTPNLIVNNMGTNDTTTNTTAAATAVINGLLTACPGVPQVLLEPFPATPGSEQAPFLQAARAACNNPSVVHYVSTTGFFNLAYGHDSSNLHPSGPNSTYMIAPQVVAALLPIMDGSTPPSSTAYA